MGKHQRLLALLREIRQEASLTQSQLAEKLGQGQPYVSKYENGEQRLDLLEIEQICAAAGIDLREFIKRYLNEGEPKV